jgi:hypothetical protein
MIPALSSSEIIPILALNTSHTSNHIPLRAMPSILRHAIQSLKGTSNSDWPLIREPPPRYQNDSRERYVNEDRGMREEGRVNQWVDTQDRGQQVRYSNDRQAPSNYSVPEPRVRILRSRRNPGRERLLDLSNLRRPSRRSMRASNAPENPSSLRGLAKQSLSRYMDQRNNKPQTNSPTSQQQRGREFDYEHEEESDDEEQDLNDSRDAERRHQESYSADRNGYETRSYVQQQRCYEMQ